MKTNDIKKGMRVKLTNGWFGTMKDNARGNIRLVDVEGYCREIGSVYSWDIESVILNDGTVHPAVYTDAQLIQKSIVDAAFKMLK